MTHLPWDLVLLSASAECCDDWTEAILQNNAAWLTAGQPLSWVTAVCCCRQRLLEAAAWLRPEVSLCESFPLLKICRNSNGFFRIKWVIQVVWKPLIIVPVIDSIYIFVTRHRWIITRRCHWPLRPGFWFTPAWLSFTGHWTLGLMQLSALSGLWMTSGTIRRRVTSAIWIITAANSAEFWSNYLHRTEQNWKGLTCRVASAHWSFPWYKAVNHVITQTSRPRVSLIRLRAQVSRPLQILTPASLTGDRPGHCSAWSEEIRDRLRITVAAWPAVTGGS